MTGDTVADTHVVSLPLHLCSLLTGIHWCIDCLLSEFSDLPVPVPLVLDLTVPSLLGLFPTVRGGDVPVSPLFIHHPGLGPVYFSSYVVAIPNPILTGLRYPLSAVSGLVASGFLFIPSNSTFLPCTHFGHHMKFWIWTFSLFWGYRSGGIHCLTVGCFRHMSSGGLLSHWLSWVVHPWRESALLIPVLFDPFSLRHPLYSCGSSSPLCQITQWPVRGLLIVRFLFPKFFFLYLSGWSSMGVDSILFVWLVFHGCSFHSFCLLGGLPCRGHYLVRLTLSLTTLYLSVQSREVCMYVYIFPCFSCGVPVNCPLWCACKLSTPLLWLPDWACVPMGWCPQFFNSPSRVPFTTHAYFLF